MESTPEKNGALVREFLTEVLAGGDLEALDIFLTDSAVGHQPALEEAEPSSARHTICGVLGAADVDITIEDLVADGDTVAVRGTVTGTHQASLIDVTSTGRTFQIAYAWFCRIEDGRIAEIWSLPDRRALHREFGSVDRPTTPDESRR